MEKTYNGILLLSSRFSKRHFKLLFSNLCIDLLLSLFLKFLSLNVLIHEKMVWVIVVSVENNKIPYFYLSPFFFA